MTHDDITLKLTKAESLVLCEWLARFDSVQTLAFDHPSEERVLWRLQGQLESILEEPLLPNYRDIVAEARRNVEADSR